MIKRRFYRDTHGDKDAPSESSSSSSGSEVDAESNDDTDIEEEDVASDVREEEDDAESSSGYESEDSSVNEVNLDSSGLPTSDEDAVAQISSQNIMGSFSGGEGNSLPNIAQHSPKKDVVDFETADCVLKRKSVFKCRICPRIVCLSEDTLKAHLISKKHARSEKLLREGRLKLMLNENGKIEGEEYFDNDATTTASQQKSDKPNEKGKGRLNKKKRPRQENESRKAKPSTENRKMRRKNDN